MSLVVAIESESVQADTLQQLLSARPDTDVVVVESKDAAIAAVDERVPDLVLVGALMSPRDEDALIAHLRTLPDAGHLQTLTIPQLRQTSGKTRRALSIFGKRKKLRTDEAAGECDPTQFGDEVAAYLSRACAVKAEIEQRKAAALEAGPLVADGPAPAQEECESLPLGSLSSQETSAVAFAQAADVEVASVSSARDAERADDAPANVTLTAELDRVRADAERTLVAELATAEERHRADIARLEAEAAESRDAATRSAEAQADETLTAELDRVRADAKRRAAAELATAEERHRADIARLEAETEEKRDAAARAAQAAAGAQADEMLTAELDRVRADAERTLADELATAEERHRTDIASLEAEAAEKRDAATLDAQAIAAARADETVAAERDRARTDAERTLVDELTAAQQRHYAELARLEAEAAEKRDAAIRDAQATAEAQSAQTLAAERDRVRADGERTQAAQLAAAAERHAADIARLQTEAAERSNAAARRAQAAAEAQAAEALAAELDRVRADAERTLAAELVAAEQRRCGDIARLETEAAQKSDAAAQAAQAAAETQAAQALAAELDRVRADAEQTLATELAAAEQRRCADIVRLETEAATQCDAATRDTRAAAEALAAEALATELAAAEARSRAEVSRVRADARKTLAERLEQVHTEAHGGQLEAADRQETVAREARVIGDRNPPLAFTPSPSSLEPVHDGDLGSSSVTDYYALWQARFAGTETPTLEAGIAPLARVNRTRRRRWALSVAATLLILLTNNPDGGSTPRPALSTLEAAGGSHAIGPIRTLDRDDALSAPIPGEMEFHDPGEPATGDTPETGVSRRAPFSGLMLQTMGVLAVMLLLRVTVFVGEGLVWHGLVATLGLVLLGLFVMRAPWGG